MPYSAAGAASSWWKSTKLNRLSRRNSRLRLRIRQRMAPMLQARALVVECATGAVEQIDGSRQPARQGIQEQAEQAVRSRLLGAPVADEAADHFVGIAEAAQRPAMRRQQQRTQGQAAAFGQARKRGRLSAGTSTRTAAIRRGPPPPGRATAGNGRRPGSRARTAPSRRWPRPRAPAPRSRGNLPRALPLPARRHRRGGRRRPPAARPPGFAGSSRPARYGVRRRPGRSAARPAPARRGTSGGRLQSNRVACSSSIQARRRRRRASSSRPRRSCTGTSAATAVAGWTHCRAPGRRAGRSRYAGSRGGRSGSPRRAPATRRPGVHALVQDDVVQPVDRRWPRFAGACPVAGWSSDRRRRAPPAGACVPPPTTGRTAPASAAPRSRAHPPGSPERPAGAPVRGCSGG